MIAQVGSHPRWHTITDVGWPVLMAETGWNGSEIAGTLNGNCETYRDDSAEDQVQYLNWLADQSETLDMDFVTWWSHRDLIPEHINSTCECASGEEGWCTAIGVFNQVMSEYYGEIMFKYWGTMGIRDYEGNEKPEVMETWRSLRGL